MRDRKGDSVALDARILRAHLTEEDTGMRRFLFGTAALAALFAFALSPVVWAQSPDPAAPAPAGAASPNPNLVAQDKSPDVKPAKKPKPPPRRVARRPPPPPPPPPYPPPGYRYYAGPPGPYWGGYPYYARPYYYPYYRPYYRPLPLFPFFW
jgi:hypothetical protein